MEDYWDIFTFTRRNERGKRVFVVGWLFYFISVLFLTILFIAFNHLSTDGNFLLKVLYMIVAAIGFLFVWGVVVFFLTITVNSIDDAIAKNRNKIIKLPEPAKTAVETPSSEDFEVAIINDIDCEIVSGDSDDGKTSDIEDASFEEIKDDEIAGTSATKQPGNGDSLDVKEFIAPEILTKLEENKQITQNPLKWVGATNLCAYFVDCYFSKSNPNDLWKIGESLFDIRNLRQSKEGYLSNKKNEGKPKGYAIIDEILQVSK